MSPRATDSGRTAGREPPAVLPLQGEPHRLEVRAAPLRASRIVHIDGVIWVLLGEGERRGTGELLGGWMRVLARRVILQRLQELAARHGYRYRRVFIRNQRTRWGSCSTRGSLSFNFRLVMAPPEVLDYVILHELVHLEVPNHSARFWARLAALCPGFRDHRRWLRRQERYLMNVIP